MSKTHIDVIKTRKDFDLLGSVWRIPVYCPDDGRHEGGVNLAWASVWNVGTYDFDEKGEIQVVETRG